MTEWLASDFIALSVRSALIWPHRFSPLSHGAAGAGPAVASLFERWGENLAIGLKLPLFRAFSISILGLSKPFEAGSEIPLSEQRDCLL